jgi:hypothetical protein
MLTAVKNMFVRRVLRSREKRRTRLPTPSEMVKRIKAMVEAESDKTLIE